MNFNRFVLVVMLFVGLASLNHAVSFISPTPANSSYLGITYFVMNVTNNSVGENFSNLTNFTFKLFYANGTVAGQFPNVTNSTGLNGTAFANYAFLNFTGLGDGNYTYNVSFFNSTGSGTVNSSETRRIVIDTISPQILFNGTVANNSFIATPYIFLTLTINDTNIANMTYRIYNGSGNVNTTNFTSNWTNFTNLADGNYTVNVTATDLAGNTNTTSTYTYVVDTTTPLVSYGLNTPANLSSSNLTSIFVNLSVTEATLNRTQFSLFYANITGTQINVTNVTGTSINFTGLGDGNYTINATVYDAAGHSNSTLSINVSVNTTNDYAINQTVTQALQTTMSIAWYSLRSTNSTVYYGTNSSSLSSSVSDLTFLTNHSASLTGLTCNTLYYYNITNCNNLGTCFTNGTFSQSTTACSTTTTSGSSTGTTSNNNITVTATPTPTATPTVTATPTPTVKATVTTIPTVKPADSNTMIGATVSGGKTTVAYKYVLPQDVNAGDSITVEFTGLSCDDYKAGLITFSVTPTSVTCGSVIANFVAQTAMKKGDTFKVNVNVNKVLPATVIKQLQSTKTTVTAVEATPAPTVVPQSSSSGTLYLWILIIAVVLSVIIFFQFKKK